MVKNLPPNAAYMGSIPGRGTIKFYAEYIIRNAGLNEAQAGIKIIGRNINNLRYADDFTLMAESEEDRGQTDPPSVLPNPSPAAALGRLPGGDPSLPPLLTWLIQIIFLANLRKF